MTRRAGPDRIARSLRRAARVGGFFDLPTGPVPGSGAGTPPGPDWYRHAELTGPAGVPVLTAVVADVASRLRVGEPRVAASLLFQGYAARLWSPVLACLRDGVVPDLDPAALWLRCRPGGSPTPWLAAPAGWQAPAEPSGLVAEVVLDRLLTPMAGALGGITAVAPALLRGNAASALAGALLVLAGQGPPGPAADVVARLLAGGALAGTGTLGYRGGRPEFRRRSCCLYYRVPGGGLCGDCVLTHVPARPAPPD